MSVLAPVWLSLRTLAVGTNAPLVIVRGSTPPPPPPPARAPPPPQ